MFLSSTNLPSTRSSIDCELSYTIADSGFKHGLGARVVYSAIEKTAEIPWSSSLSNLPAGFFSDLPGRVG